MPRPLPTPVVFLLVLATAVGLEASVREAYRTKNGLVEKAEAFAEKAKDDEKNLVVLGTCLPEQHLDEDLVAARMGGGWHVYNLGFEATNALDWYLAVAHRVPLEKVDGFVIGYGDGDLSTAVMPWESRVGELATLRDIPDLLRFGCTAADCRVDLALRTLSATWRYRNRVANAAWAALGAGTGQRADPPPPQHSVGQARASVHYLRALIDRAGDAGIPVWLLPLPRRPGSTPSADGLKAEADVLAGGGVSRLEITELAASNFSSDVHLTHEGGRLLSRAVAAELREALGLPEPPETAAASAPAGPALGDHGEILAPGTLPPGPPPMSAPP